MSRNQVSKMLGSLPAFGAILFIFITAFPPIDNLEDTNISLHMLEHVIIVAAGVLISYPIYRRGLFRRVEGLKTGVAALLAVVAIVVFWHVPPLWNEAVLYPSVHIVEHVFFLTAGFLLGLSIPMLSDNLKVILIVVGMSAHMFYGFTLYLSQTPIYAFYPLAQQQTLGWEMFAPAPVYLIGYLYFSLTRESRRLEQLEGFYKPTGRRWISKDGRRRIIALCSLLMILTMGVYFSTNVVIASALPQSTSQIHPRQDAIIQIEDGGPSIYWQYYPQTVKVVIGVNNTVVWVNRSYTYHTVTSDDGNLISSGPLNVGDNFTFTFPNPGVYHYHCQYHPFMQGTVIVVNSS